MLATAAFGAIGLLDDYLKITRRTSGGLAARYKMGLQILVALAVGLALMWLASRNLYNTRLIFPFFKQLIPDLGWAYVALVMLVLVGASNAVNLTDGLDGLAISTFAVAAACFTALAYVTGHAVFADYLLLVRFPPAAELTIFCGALVGASLGFLWYNCYPAEIFMGDVGSLGARRRARHRGDPHQAGNPAGDRRRRLRRRSALGHHPGRLLQAHRAAGVPHGAAPPPLRAHRLERAEGDHAIPHRRDPLRALQPHHAQAAMTASTTATSGPGRPAFTVDGRRVLVVGAARSGLAAAELLVSRGAVVTLTDRAPSVPGEERLRAVGVELDLGGHDLERFTGADLIVTSPGVPPELAELRAARAAGVAVIGELELAWRWLKGRVIAITGTKGKSTTTTLVGRMLEASGKQVLVGGNIGVPLSAHVDRSTPETLHVVEASSFQLETTDTFHPWIAALLNLSADHLDRHPDVAAYGRAKARIFANQTRRRLDRRRRRSAGGPRPRRRQPRPSASLLGDALARPRRRGEATASSGIAPRRVMSPWCRWPPSNCTDGTCAPTSSRPAPSATWPAPRPTA